MVTSSPRGVAAGSPRAALAGYALARFVTNTPRGVAAGSARGTLAGKPLLALMQIDSSSNVRAYQPGWLPDW